MKELLFVYTRTIWLQCEAQNGENENGVDLRQKIIDTAWELFYKNGYENTTVNDIIREMELRKVDFIIILKQKKIC